MAKRRTMINGFTPGEASAVVGLSVHMLNYLARHGYLTPCYGSAGRGKTRYYSYRDLVIARVVARLLAAGLEIGRLKKGIAQLARSAEWSDERAGDELRMLATDGTSLFFLDGRGSLQDLTHGNQLAFAFVLDVEAIRSEVVAQLDPKKREHFSLRNRKLRAG